MQSSRAWRSFLHSTNRHTRKLSSPATVIDAPRFSLSGKKELSSSTHPHTCFAGRPSTERLWKEYFADPSQWWDKRKSKENPRYPDFKHKMTNDSLWINGWYNPSWVKDMFEETELANKGLHKAKAPELQEDSSWEMLSLEEALTSLERMPQPPSIESFICILQKCRKKKNQAYAQRLLAYMCKNGLEAHRSLGNYLVPMLVEAGSMCDAQQVFYRLQSPNEYSWTSLITGYIECGESQHAIILYQKMREDCVHPSGHTFVALLKACAMLKDENRGQDIHAEIARNGLERDIFVGNTLINMYAKCGLIAKAREVFDKLQIRDKVSWNALITAYAEHGIGEVALECFEQMQLEGISPNGVTFVCSLKACGGVGAIERGQEMHVQIARKGLLESDPIVGNTLVDMYAKCGCLLKARELFDNLPVRDKVTWNALIAGYAKHGLGEEALNCLEWMQLEGVSPDAPTFVCSLKACGGIGAIDKGQELHAEITRKGLLERDPFVGNALVDMYTKCGLLAKAQEVFDKLQVRDVVSWTALIAGYAEHSLGEDTLDCFLQMQLEGISPNALTFACSLKACGNIGDIDNGRDMHAEIVRKGLLESDPLVGNAVVDMYAKCGSVVKAHEVFDNLPVRDSVSWNALLTGYIKHGLAEETLNCFEQMQLEGVSLDDVAFVCSLKACGSTKAIDKGKEIHADIAMKGLFESDPFVGSALVDMYAKCGSLARAEEVFDKLPVRDEVSWNALMAAYAEHGLGEKALYCFEQMQLEGISPNVVTFACGLKVCGSIRAIHMGQKIHAEIAKRGFLERKAFIGNCLIDMYAKCGLLAKAKEVFEKLPVQNVVSWNSLMTGYVKHGLAEEALNCFDGMQLQGVSPDALTFSCSLKACGSIGAIDKGQELHCEVARMGLERDLLVGSTLVDMYAKCGLPAKAQEVFDNLPVRDVVSWTALITGYANLGECENVFHMLERMSGEGVKPDRVTFLSILTACSHTGLVDTGEKYFEAMSKDYGLTPMIEHHTCMVDVLCRAGQLDEALVMMKKMPFQPNLAVWHTVLGACQKWGNVELGRQAFEHAVQLDKTDAATYVLMSNIYADAHIKGA